MKPKLIAGFDGKTKEAFQSWWREHPSATVNDGVAWFKARGKKVSRNALWRYRREMSGKQATVSRVADLAAELRAVGGGYYLRLTQTGGETVIEVHDEARKCRQGNDPGGPYEHA
jgi:hypothetical protein